MARLLLVCNSMIVKKNHKNKQLTLGEFIATVYDVCEREKAGKIIQHAISERHVVFLGKTPLLLS